MDANRQPKDTRADLLEQWREAPGSHPLVPDVSRAGYRLGATALETLRRIKYNVLTHRKGKELEPLGD